MYFEKKIDARTKDSVAKFLVEHFRYNTMGPTNRATSYANCVKVNRLGLTGTALEKAYQVMEVDGHWEDSLWPIRDFEKEHMGDYTIGLNDGCYLVLLEAEFYDPGYRSTCSHCGKLHFPMVASHNSNCYVCGRARKNLKSALRWTRAKGGNWRDRPSAFCNRRPASSRARRSSTFSMRG